MVCLEGLGVQAVYEQGKLEGDQMVPFYLCLQPFINLPHMGLRDQDSLRNNRSTSSSSFCDEIRSDIITQPPDF